MSPRRRFEIPITLEDGRELETLADAAAYIERLPKREQDAEPWRKAIAALIKAIELGGPFVFIARVALSHAIHGKPAPPIGKGPRVKKREAWRARRRARSGG